VAGDTSPFPPDLIERLPPEVLGTCRTLRERGHAAWLVGGALRDLLRDPDADPASLEWDVATSATPAQVVSTFERTIPTGVRHGTVTVVADGRKLEVTTFRGESGYSDGRRPDAVTFLDDIADDLARRDFTINAMALDPLDPTFLDPFGGRDDLRRSVLHTVGDPRERFREDGLRPMRGARFCAALELEPAGGLVEAMRDARAVFASVSAERKREELVKIMGAARPSRAFRLLERAGYLPELFPGLEDAVGCEQGGYHLHDVWEHSLRCMDECPRDDWRLRLAGLLHDAGKPATAESAAAGDGGPGEGRTRFHGHEKVGADMARRWLRRLRFSREDEEWIAHVIRHHIVMYSPRWSDAAIRRFINRVGRERVDAVLRLANADVKAQGRSAHLLELAEELGRRVRGQLSADSAFSLVDLAIDGHDVMEHLGLEPGPEVGRILEALLSRVLDEPHLNDRRTLLSLASGIHEEA
jgi:tRNA nucleotidyltransferase (CCA-adding enzyme)